MKKVIGAMMLLSLILCLIINASSEEIPDIPVIISDSGQITEEEWLMLKVIGRRNQLEKFQIVKIYGGCFLSGFANEATLSSLLNDGYIEEVQYALWNMKDRQYDINYCGVNIAEKEFIEMNLSNQRGVDERWFECAFSYEDIFDSTLATADLDQLEVTEKYIFNAYEKTEGVFVYYVTNYGDYIYYLPNPNLTDKAYLLPYEKFCDLAKIIYQNFDSSRGYGGRENIEDLYDLSEYKVGSADARRARIVSCCALIIIIPATAVFIIRKKKKKAVATTAPQPEQTA